MFWNTTIQKRLETLENRILLIEGSLNNAQKIIDQLVENVSTATKTLETISVNAKQSAKILHDLTLVVKDLHAEATERKRDQEKEQVSDTFVIPGTQEKMEQL